MRKTLRGALLSALCFGGLTLLAAPTTAQGGGGTNPGPNCTTDEQDKMDCDEEMTVMGEDPGETIEVPDPGPDPGDSDPVPTDPPPTVTTCLTCHPDPHDDEDDEEERRDCSMHFLALNAASELEDRECTFFPLNTTHTRRCHDARQVYVEALAQLTHCLYSHLGLN